jgi:hypothetical protein
MSYDLKKVYPEFNKYWLYEKTASEMLKDEEE